MTAFRPVLDNAGWNLLGNLLPLLAGLAAVPFLAQRLGTERFGLLSLAWILIGYFGLFDFGLGRALTRMVAQRWRGRGDRALDSLCSTGLALGLAAGLAGGLLVTLPALLSDHGFWDVPLALKEETRWALAVVGIGVLPTVAAAVLRGILEGVQRFKALNLIRVPAGVLLFVAPCLTAAWSPRLDLAVAALVATRWLVLAAHLVLCLASVRLSSAAVESRWVAPMLRFGGWLTVSNVVGPVIVYLDRFVIGALLPLNQLAYYAAPFEMVSRLLVLPTSLAGALFPALADVQHRDAGQARELWRRAARLVAALVVPVAALGAAAAEPILRLWLGEEFAQHGTLPMQILLAGFAFNALAQVPMAALHGHGLAHQTAYLHLIELPLYAVALIAMVGAFGLAGAAIAWSARGAVDMAVLGLLLRRAERSEVGS